MTLTLTSTSTSDRALAVLQEIQRIVSEELEVTREISAPDRLVADLELDSLGLTVLAVGLENTFRVKLTEEDSLGVSTVGDLTQLVVQRMEEQLGAASPTVTS